MAPMHWLHGGLECVLQKTEQSHWLLKAIKATICTKWKRATFHICHHNLSAYKGKLRDFIALWGGGGGWLICVWWQLVANATMRIIFSLECPPSAKLLLESPDGVIKPLQSAQMSERFSKLEPNSERWRQRSKSKKNYEGAHFRCYSVFKMCQIMAKCPRHYQKGPSYYQMSPRDYQKSATYYQKCPRERT